MQTDLGKRGDASGNRQRGPELWVPCRDRGEPVMVVARGRVALSAAAPEWSARTARRQSPGHPPTVGIVRKSRDTEPVVDDDEPSI